MFNKVIQCTHLVTVHSNVHSTSLGRTSNLHPPTNHNEADTNK